MIPKITRLKPYCAKYNYSASWVYFPLKSKCPQGSGSSLPVSQDVVEIKCTALLRLQALGHQIEDAEVVLVGTEVD